MMKQIRTGIPALAALIVLILDSKTALRGAAEGITLCLQTVIPSLFPFLVLTSRLTASFQGSDISLLRPLGKLCRIPRGSESLLLTGFLGGYPAGAQCVAQAYRAGQLSRDEAERMLGFCSNAGPAFLFGIVAAKFPDFTCALTLFAIHILSALTVGSILPGGSNKIVRLESGKEQTISEAVFGSVRIMAAICGWILIFRVITAILDRWLLWLLPPSWQILVIGILDLANGCCELEYVTNSGLRFIMASGILAFGGICVTMQTLSVAAGLKINWYLTGKLLQSLISISLAAVWQSLFFPTVEQCFVQPVLYLCAAIFLSGMILILHKKQKNSSNSAPAGV